MTAVLVEKALDLTEQMYVFALQGEWDLLAGLQLEQSQSVGSLFQGNLSFSDDEIGTLKRISFLLTSVIDLTEQAKKEIALQLHQAAKADTAQKAYQQNL